jgi:hypothetical protein
MDPKNDLKGIWGMTLVEPKNDLKGIWGMRPEPACIDAPILNIWHDVCM